MRRTLIAGNWKMYKLPSEGVQWLDDLLSALAGEEGIEADLLLNVPATHLVPMSMRLRDTNVGLGAQDVSAHDEGAYTGEISGAMLADAGASHVIVGHSERRAYHGEDDALVNAKLEAALRHGLIPILCVGETEGQRDAGEAETVVVGQLRGALSDLDLAGEEIVVAYEPVWAIGTGRTATADDAQQMCALVRQELDNLRPGIGDSTLVLYGGSMKPGNASELLAQEDIDGGLVGGASLDVSDLLAIARSA